MAIQLIVGLKNPGESYSTTRHNAGEWFVRLLAEHFQVAFKFQKAFFGELATFEWSNRKIHLFKPFTFMNESGRAVRAIAQFYKIPVDDILIAHDELDLPVGSIKFKTGGGHGGHNGLRDLIRQLASQQFHRMRIGIGHPGHKALVHDYVLGKPSQADKQRIDDALSQSMHVLPDLFNGEYALVMNALHTSKN